MSCTCKPSIVACLHVPAMVLSTIYTSVNRINIQTKKSYTQLLSSLCTVRTLADMSVVHIALFITSTSYLGDWYILGQTNNIPNVESKSEMHTLSIT